MGKVYKPRGPLYIEDEQLSTNGEVEQKNLGLRHYIGVFG